MAKKKEIKKAQEKKISAYVVSRASQDIEYTDWAYSKTGLCEKVFSVLVKGGANVVDHKTLETANGVVTPVSDEEAEFLANNSTFQRHQQNGFVELVTSRNKAESIAEEESDVKDGSAQLTKQDFIDRGQTPPVVGDAN